jgi:MerR family transcriptional regulator, light-induced transcriptional regulator
MNQFSIRDIENLCGVKAHTLRIWEQRYKLFVPKRKKSQHRIYDCDDLKELLRISFLYHHGYKISKIASLTASERQEEVARIKPQCCNYEIFVHQLIDACITFDKEVFEKVVNSLVLRIGLEKSIINVFYPFLHRIGLLWMTNHVVPAQEHFASHIIRKKIICAIDGLELNNDGKYNVVIFAPTGELHEIPLLVINYLLRKHGIWTTYFGTNVKHETLLYYSGNFRVTHFYMHVITHLDNCGLESITNQLCKEFPGQQIIVSGPACGCVKTKFPNLLHFHSVDELTAFAMELKNT